MDNLTQIRTTNFLRILKEQYRNSPQQFENSTGYPANMVSQIKTGKKFVHDELARRLESLIPGLDPLALDRVNPDIPAARTSSKPLEYWPFSVPIKDFKALSPRIQLELDAMLTRQIIGYQAEAALRHTKKKKPPKN